MNARSSAVMTKSGRDPGIPTDQPKTGVTMKAAPVSFFHLSFYFSQRSCRHLPQESHFFSALYLHCIGPL